MENNSVINTVQNVNIDYNLADIGIRVVAYLLDGVFKILYFFILYFILFVVIISNTSFLKSAGETDFVLLFILIFIFLAPIAFYSVYFPMFMQGSTPGKAIMKIKIVREDGLQAGFGTYFVRWLLGLVDFQLISPLLGLVVMSTTKKHQRVADLIAKTIVITMRQSVDIQLTTISNFAENYQPVFGQVLRLSDKDIRIISQSFIIAKKQNDQNTIEKLRKKIEEIILEYHPEMTDTIYVATVFKEFHFFSEQ
jgi:uncharacterized RDD family membrane protein YckC